MPGLRLSRADGVALGFTDHDQALELDGSSFEPESGFAASEIRSSSDLGVDDQDVAGVLSSDRMTKTDILDRRWDNASVELWRVIAHPKFDPAGHLSESQRQPERSRAGLVERASHCRRP